jgi:hypothetical protein
VQSKSARQSDEWLGERVVEDHLLDLQAMSC